MISERISRIKEKRGLSQEKLAHMLNIHVVTLSRWENGHFEPKASTIKKLCEILGCSEAELLNGPNTGKVEVLLSWNWDEMKKDEERRNQYE